MPITFAGAGSHAPGITAWSEAAPAAQREHFYAGYDVLRRSLDASGTEVLVLLTSEHWANFFLDHVSPYCVGLAESFEGPIEPWLRIDRTRVPGDPELAGQIVNACYDHGIEPSFSHELEFDHGSMVPLHLLTPSMHVPVVPILFNTLSAPQPTARRCGDLGRVVGHLARHSPRRIGLFATGGLSHDPGERNHGVIDTEFDRRFLTQMANGDIEALARYTREELAAAGAGAFELLSGIALAGALNGRKGTVAAYEAVQGWATGVGVIEFDVAVEVSQA